MSSRKILPLLLFPIVLFGNAAAATVDNRILSLVPPGSQLVAGVSAPPTHGQPNNFLLLTQDNWLDLQDFLALTGVDSSLSIHQMIFVAFSSGKDQDEHGILVSGQFDRSRVFNSAISGGAIERIYRQISVLEIQPFARERARSKSVRWLAILDSDVLLFGSVAATQIELDRYLTKSRADESMRYRLGLLRSKDQTWCLLSSSSRTRPSLTRGRQIQNVLSELSPELAEFAQSGNELEFGFHYGRRVEFDYVVKVQTSGSDRDIREPLASLRFKPPIGFSLMPGLSAEAKAGILRGTISISMSRFEAWLISIKDRKVPAD